MISLADPEDGSHGVCPDTLILLLLILLSVGVRDVGEGGEHGGPSGERLWGTHLCVVGLLRLRGREREEGKWCRRIR